MDIPFDLYGLLVENIFGSILVSAIALLVIMCIIALMGRMSNNMLFFWVMAFVMVFTIGYLGGVALILLTIFGMMYFFNALLQLIIKSRIF